MDTGMLTQFREALSAPAVRDAIDPVDGVQHAAALAAASSELTTLIGTVRHHITEQIVPGVADLDARLAQLQAGPRSSLDAVDMIDTSDPLRVLNVLQPHLEPGTDVTALHAVLSESDALPADVVRRLGRTLVQFEHAKSNGSGVSSSGSADSTRVIANRLISTWDGDQADPGTTIRDYLTAHPGSTAVVVSAHDRSYAFVGDGDSGARSKTGPRRSFGRAGEPESMHPAFLQALPGVSFVYPSDTGRYSPLQHATDPAAAELDEDLRASGIFLRSRDGRIAAATDDAATGHAHLGALNELVGEANTQLGAVAQARRGIEELADIDGSTGALDPDAWSTKPIAFRNGSASVLTPTVEFDGFDGLSRVMPNTTPAEAAHWLQTTQDLDKGAYGVLVDDGGVTHVVKLSDSLLRGPAEDSGDFALHPDLRAIVDRATHGIAYRSTGSAWHFDIPVPSVSHVDQLRALRSDIVQQLNVPLEKIDWAGALVRIQSAANLLAQLSQDERLPPDTSEVARNIAVELTHRSDSPLSLFGGNQYDVDFNRMVVGATAIASKVRMLDVRPSSRFDDADFML